MDDRSQKIERYVPVAIALWLHSFNVLFVYFEGLSNEGLQLLVLLSAPVVGVCFLAGKRKNECERVIIWLFVAFFTWCIIRLPFHAELNILFRLVNFAYLNVLVFLYLSSVKDGFRKILINYAFLGIFTLLYLISQILGIEYRNEMSIHPNLIGLIAVSVILCAIAIENLVLRLVIYFIAGFLVILVSSRTSIACFMIIVFYDAFWLRKYGFLGVNRILGRFSIALVYLVSSFFFMFQILNQLFLFDDEYRGVGTGMSGRSGRWEAVLEACYDNLFFGVGYGESGEYLGFTPDNAYLTVLLELGFLGFVIYIIINWTAMVGCLRRNQRYSVIILLIYWIYGIFEMRYFSIGNSLSLLYLFTIYNCFFGTLNVNDDNTKSNK
jgi:O-antigen ligase